MAKGLIDVILDQIFDANWQGRRGEKLTSRELKLVRLLGRKGYILRNIYIPKDDGETTEIDVVYITQKGIFVIESKNYSGWIFGSENQRYWTASLANGTKNSFFNPIIQNKVHIKWLDLFLDQKVPLFSIIAFSERCELKKISVTNRDVRVIKRDRIYATIRDIWDNTPDSLTPERIDEIHSILKNLTLVDTATKQLHIENIQNRYHSTSVSLSSDNASPQETIISTDDVIDDTVRICPKCQSSLVKREAKKGKHQGNIFYGCSNFPKCRYIENLPDDNTKQE